MSLLSHLVLEPLVPFCPQDGVGVAGEGVAGERCGRDFFDRPCKDLAKALLGCVVVRVCGGDECRGMVVETEAYLGGEDKAAHSYNGHRTKRNEAMYMDPGTAYVYSVYGMHCCLNVSSRGEGAAVLLRALEPMGGLEGMRERRKAVKREKDLCNGPAKLCQALAINKSCDKLDLVSCQELWLEHGAGNVGEMASRERVGVEYAGEWASKPLRFYLQDSQCVSKR